MIKALKKIASVLLIAVSVTACSANGDTQQPEPDISDTASVTAAEETKESEIGGAAGTDKPADETTTTTATTTTTPVTTTTTTAATTTTAPPLTTTTTTAATTTKPPAAAPSPSSSTDFTEEVFLLVNRIRAEYGLPAYKRLDALSSAAQKRANEISGYYSHTRPNGQPSYSVLKEYGLSYSATGENIAAGQMTPQAVVNAWMSSTMGHREAILSSKYQYMGVGYVCLTSGDRQGYKYYWTQEFYTPL